MSTQLKLRRGTTAQHSTFTGASGEITVDTDKKTVVVHDGSTAGGNPLLTANGSQVISANTSSDALRITQTGAGNALVVEDSANPDSTPFVVSNQGAVGIGDPTPNATLGGTGISLKSADAYLPQIQMQNTTANNNGTFLLFKKDRSGAIVQNDDTLSTMSWQGYDGASYLATAAIAAQVDGTPGTNDMPGRLVFSTTADGASSPTERMRIDSSGNVGIGATAAADTRLRVSGALPSSGTVSYGITVSDAIIPSASTAAGLGFSTTLQTQAASFTVGSLYHYNASQGTIGAGSAVTNQYGYYVQPTLTGATNNYGFYSQIASGTGRYNFYAAGSADNYFGGSIGIKALPVAGYTFIVGGSATGATTGIGALVNQSVQSDVTSAYRSFQSTTGTAAASFTLSDLTGFAAFQGTIGAGSSVTNQYGFYAGSNITGATNNYGFVSALPSGTGRYNFYAAGSAANYFAGNTQIANYLDVTTVNAAGFGLRVRADAADTYAGIQFTNTAVSAQWAKITSPAANVLSFQDGGSVEKMRIDSSGNLIQTAPTTAPTLSTNGTMVFNLTSNTNLRVSVRGSDGVTRTANLTLA